MKNNLLVIIFIVIIFLYINKNNIEKMTEINTEKKLLEEYKKDIDSIRSLATIANQLQSENGLTLPGTLNIPSNLNVTGSFNLLPKGTIVAFNGQSAPYGWAICNGDTVKDLNNQNYLTPDLRGRFIYGYNNSRFGQRGGNKDAILVSHNHGGKTSEDGRHRHHYNDIYMFEHSGPDGGSHGSQGADHDNEHEYTRGKHTDYVENHTHTISSDGESGTDKNLPPYVILLYIIKL